MPEQDQSQAAGGQLSDFETPKQQLSPEKNNLTCGSPNHGTFVETPDGVRYSQPDAHCPNSGTINGLAKHRHNMRSVSESDCDEIRSSDVSPSIQPEPGLSQTLKADMDLLNDDLSDLPFPDEVLLPVPPDGGWGWVIVCASFVCCAVVDGLCSVFGILLPDLVVYFEESSSKMSLAGSVLAGGFLLSGPIASVVINCLGCRWATIIGAILSAVAMITCTFSTSVLMFILLFGALGGLGIGLIYLPASVMVGYYFERRRGLAAGISSAGAGFGMLVLSLLAAFLVKQFGWKGCLVIMAGVCLQCLVCGSLMRPLVATLPVLKPDAFHEDDEQEQQKKTIVKHKSVQPKFSPNLEVIKENVPLASSATIKPVDLPDVKSDAMQNAAEPKLSLGIDSATVVKRDTSALNRRIAGSCVELDLKRLNSVSSNKPINASKRRRISQEKAPSRSNDYHSCQELSYGKISDSLLGLPIRRSPSIASETTVTPMMKKDIFYSGSLASLQNSISRTDKDADSVVFSISDMYHPAAFEQKSVVSQAVHMLKEMMDISVLFNGSFLIICSASVLIQLAYFVPIVFLPAYALSIGLSSEQAAMLLAIAGLSTTVGRSVAGALASLRCVNGLHLNSLSLIVAGIVTNFVVLCTRFELLVLYGVIFGLAVSGFVPMTTVFLVKYVGLDKLTNSFGLLSMIKGVATMAGPPIAGALLDRTKSYNSTFLFSGILFILSGFLFYCLPLTEKPISLRHDCTPFYCSSKENVEVNFSDDCIESDRKCNRLENVESM